MTFERCALTGYDLKPENFKPVTGSVIEYETEFIGKVKITLSAYHELLAKDFYPERYIMAGICKNNTLNNIEPVLIDPTFISGGYKNLNPPLEFDEKCNAFLKSLYLLHGKINEEFELNYSKHFTMAYADWEEFGRIVDQLESDYSITIRKTHIVGRERWMKLYMGVKVTNSGKERAKRELPKMPMVGLVSQVISTGDREIDEKINHAKELFFNEPITMDKMRSACETLSYVLEPLREKLKDFFAGRDVSDFFNIVNNFDIRHNKDSTKNLIHEEQMEWVFYSLLNTINAYSKLKAKGK